MEVILRKYVIPVYFLSIILDCIFLYFDLPYIAVTEPFLIPLLVVYLFLNDENIGSPPAKFIFYLGLFFSFFGDVLQLVVTNGIFFFGSLVTFMVMNICYAVSLLSLHKKIPSSKILIPFVLFVLTGISFIIYMGNGMGALQKPIIAYIATLILLSTSSISLLYNPAYRKTALQFFIPAVGLEILQNFIFALNLFQWGAQNQLFTISILLYGISQFLWVKGILKVYL